MNILRMAGYGSVCNLKHKSMELDCVELSYVYKLETDLQNSLLGEELGLILNCSHSMVDHL